MSPQEWFDALARHLPAGGPLITADERAALLDLARLAAHTSERWTAPVTTFLVGVALAGRESADRLQCIRALTRELDQPAGPETERSAK